MFVSIKYKGLYYHHSYDEHPESKTYQLHCHNLYEIYFFIRGEGSFIIEGNRYELKRNNMLIMRPSEFHCFKFDKPLGYERCALHFNSEELFECLSDKTLLSPFLDHEPGKNNLIIPREEDGILDIINRMDECSNLTLEECKLKTQFILGELLTTILSISRRSLFAPNYDSSNTLANSLLEYINSNITLHITLDDLANKFYMSKYYLSHIFKKYTGVSILEYILRKKVLFATQLIENGKKSFEVAEQCGFGDYSTFYRTYKRITGSPPSKSGSKK